MIKSIIDSDTVVTVWCLAYNHEKYIRKTLEGFAAQKTSFKFQVLVHDDASTDNTQSIIREFEEKYPDIIKPIYQTENQFQKGINKVTEYLLPMAQGKYLAFCEGDDYWCDENKLQMQYDIMEKDSSLSMCAHNVQCINEDGSMNERVIPESCYGLTASRRVSQKEFADMLWYNSGYPFHTSSYFIRREAMPIDPYAQVNKYINGDQAMMRMALMHGDVYFLEEKLSHRRLMSDGNWNQKFLTWSADKKFNYFFRKVEGELVFDKLSGGEYHKHVTHCLYKFLSTQGDYREKVMPLYEKYKDEYRVKDVNSSKIKLKWNAFVRFPKAFDMIRKLTGAMKKR